MLCGSAGRDDACDGGQMTDIDVLENMKKHFSDESAREVLDRAINALSAIEHIKTEIEEIRLEVHTELVKQEYRSFYLSGAHGALVRVLQIIDKHTSGKKPQESDDKE